MNKGQLKSSHNINSESLFNTHFVALHKGSGFGSAAIKEKSISVARAAQKRKNERLAEIATQPFGTSNELRASVYPLSDIQIAIDKKFELGTIFKSFESNTAFGLAKPQAISRAELFCAWAVDFLFAASTTFISSFVSRAFFLLKGQSLYSILVQDFNINLKFLENMAAENQALAAVIILAIVIVWTVQSVLGFVARTTIGGFVVGVSASTCHSRVASGFIFGVLQVISLGGLLKIPFLILAPEFSVILSGMKLEKSL